MIQKDRFFLRAYMTHEDAGKSYDPVFTAFKMQESQFSNSAWDQRYRNYYRKILSVVNSLSVCPDTRSTTTASSVNPVFE